MISDNKVMPAENFLEYFNSGYRSLFREKINKYRSTNCIDCKYNNQCNGGCPLFYTYFNPEVELKGFE